MSSAIDSLRNQLGYYFGLNSDAITFYWKARVGLYSLLDALGVGPGDEVMMPAYTCVVVPNAVKYLGATPVYVDIDPETYNIDTSRIEAALTSNCKVILAQNTYGLSADIDPIKEIARRANAAVIEDCTHGFGGSYKGRKNGLNVDAAFFSTQWNKTFSTGVGGFVLCKDSAIAQKMVEAENRLISPKLSSVAILKLQLFIRQLLGYSSIYWSALKFYRYLSHHNILVGSSSGGELTGLDFPDRYLTAFSECQAKRALKELNNIKANLSHRSTVAKQFDACLDSMEENVAFRPSYADHTFIKYPLLVRDREKVMSIALRHNVPLGDWFLSPLHPVESGLERWNLNREQFPVSSAVSKHMINLPTDMFVTSRVTRRILKFLKEIKDQIISFEEL
jgi:perosamine synthetase